MWAERREESRMETGEKQEKEEGINSEIFFFNFSTHSWPKLPRPEKSWEKSCQPFSWTEQLDSCDRNQETKQQQSPDSMLVVLFHVCYVCYVDVSCHVCVRAPICVCMLYHYLYLQQAFLHYFKAETIQFLFLRSLAHSLSPFCVSWLLSAINKKRNSAFFCCTLFVSNLAQITWSPLHTNNICTLKKFFRTT